jgi:hypothetical protein
MELTDELKATYLETAQALKGSDRRVFMARIVKALGAGGQSRAARELGWCRDTIRKGRREVDSGQRLEDNFGARGRKQAEKLPDYGRHQFNCRWAKSNRPDLSECAFIYALECRRSQTATDPAARLRR